MRLLHHGGECCGIKTICDLGSNPDFKSSYPIISEYDAETARHFNLDEDDYINADKNGETVCSGVPIFTEGSTKGQTYREALETLVEWVKKNRPSHMIEVVITVKGNYDQSKWVPVLEEIGFKQSCEWLNSNSGNVCAHYHLIVEQGKVVK